MKLFAFFLFIFCIDLARAQTVPIRIFYNTDWKITNPKFFRNYRDCSWNTQLQQFEGPFTDYSIGDHKICEGVYEDGQVNGPTKYFDIDSGHYRTSFFTSGNLDSVHYFTQNEDEKKLVQSVIIDEESFSVRTFTDSAGNQLVVNGTGFWYLKQPGNTVLEGRFENGRKAGTWRYRRKNGQIILMESYRKGKLREALFYNANGTEELNSSSFTAALFTDAILERINSLEFDIHASRKEYPELHFLPEISISSFSDNADLKSKGEFEQAEYPGGDSSLGFLFSTNLRYPEQDKRKGIEGQVYVGFVVDLSGNARNFQVLKGLSPKCDEEALRVLSLMQPWQPATLNGEAVASQKVVPITFRLVSR